MKKRVNIRGLNDGFASYGVSYGPGEVASIVKSDADILVKNGEAEYVNEK